MIRKPWLGTRTKSNRIVGSSSTREDDTWSEWDEERLRIHYQGSADVKIQNCRFGEASETITIVYCEGLVDIKQISDFVLPALEQVFQNGDPGAETWDKLHAKLTVAEIQADRDMSVHLFSGALLLLHRASKRMYAHNIESIPKRSPSESATEISLKGPRDGFTEELSTNIALIRKRLHTHKLYNERFILGVESQTTVSLVYLDGVINPNLVEEARRRILSYRNETALLSSSQLEETLGDSKFSLFPLIDYMGRPDYVAQSLIRGRFAVLVNGSPMALIAPSGLTEQLKSPEDLHLPYYFVALERSLRFIGLFIAIYLPGFWVALCAFNMEQLPFRLLATVSNSRQGLPLSTSMEAVLMLGLFELFREAGIRLPKAVGQTVAVVGGLIVGDAAIRAGLTSPTLLVVSAVTAVSTFTLVNQSLSGSVSVLRIFVLLGSSIFGMFGFFISMFAIVAYLSGLSSFGVGYLEPLSPVTFKDILRAVWAVPKKWKQTKADSLKQQNLYREEP
ncbi:spore germination protein [Paenibacillus koleovorans]|uniref:spore germination protein n=1 Tax=Paenibacillus koleovorans TaxID=121608 RepID=UPI000FD74861|nr:spore germination protein [Paenibacillus koleovorans]